MCDYALFCVTIHQNGHNTMYRDTKRRVTLRHFIGFLQIFAFFVKIFAKKFGGKEKMSTFAIPNEKNGSPNAEIAQLVEHNLAKVGVASSSLVFRSKKEVSSNADLLFETKSTDLLSFGSRIFTRRGSIICQSSLCTRSAFLFYSTF